MKTSTLFTTAWLVGAGLAIPVQHNASVAFSDCPTDIIRKGSRMKCGSIEVPMDWDNPSSRKIKINVSKLPAKDPSKRIGPLFWNPGGPGIILSTYIAQVVTGDKVMKEEILDQFDIIGVDTRGTGLSTPINCDRDIFNERPIFWATTPEVYEESVKRNQAFRQSCINGTGFNLVDYMDSVSSAHDHEAVRQALGGEKLTWLGQSYGTFLGSIYAEHYAQNIRGMILDGVASASQSANANFPANVAATEATMNYFFDWCAKSDLTSCRELTQNATKTLPKIWDDIITRAAESPIPAPQCVSGKLSCHPAANAANPGYLRMGATQMLYEPGLTFSVLANAIAEAAFKNDASLFLNSTWFIAPGESRYNASYWESCYIQMCSDLYDPTVNSPTQLMWWQQIARKDAPHTEGMSPTLFFTHPCLGYPKPRYPRHRISIPDSLSSKVLIVTNLYDPSTPTTWALQLQEEIGEDRAVVLGRDQPGHTAYFETPAFNGPTVAAMNKYLLTLETPDQRTVYDN